MGLVNQFRFIGRCFGDAYLTRTKADNLRVQFMLLVKDDFVCICNDVFVVFVSENSIDNINIFV